MINVCYLLWPILAAWMLSIIDVCCQLAVLQTVAANFTVEEFSEETEDRPTEPEGRTRRTEPSASSSSVDVWCIKNMQSVVRWVSHIIGVSSGLSREHRRSRSGQKQTEVVFECFVKKRDVTETWRKKEAAQSNWGSCNDECSAWVVCATDKPITMWIHHDWL